MDIPKGEWVVYILQSVPRPMRTYAGVTNHLSHRIRQHNGEIKGGARATCSTRPWKLYAVVRGFGDDKRTAMRFEWFTKMKHYKCSGGVPGESGIERRYFLLNYACTKCDVDVKICYVNQPEKKEPLEKKETSKLAIVI
jgi:predicted GIY-YIG superfamily endonuclease